jgi:very-short-patch-repair endonuclease
MDSKSIIANSSEGPISVQMQISRTVNYASQQNDVPVIHSLLIRNNTDSVLKDLNVLIDTEPAFSRPKEITIASIGPKETYNLGTIDLVLSHDFLSNLAERIVGAVQVSVTTSEGTFQTSEKIALLAYDEWSGLSGIPEMLAAFVLPNHPAIETILAKAASLLKKWTGDASLSGYQSEDKNRVVKTVAAIYSALQQCGIRYINPPASFEESGQKIRTPDRILDNRMGTCLDLAVLAAACLEQVGLHPLICVTKGHAFPGVWLEEECFPECSTDDVLCLRKRVELDEIFVFETTLITADIPVPFEQAVKEARRLLENQNDFRCVIDIYRSRKSGIRPLPIRSSIAKASQLAPTTNTASPYTEAPSIPLITDFGEYKVETPAEETPASRLERWKRKLLDLTMRNRLLNFRETNKTLPLLCPDLASLEDALADGKAFTVYPRPNELKNFQQRNAEVHRARTGNDAIEGLLREELKAHRLRADASDTEVNRRLVEIYREARTRLEESGANTLYLALGFLAWYELNTSDQQRLAPIILIPLEIERKSVQEGFKIRQGDDEPMINVTLLELLKRDFDLSIPDIDPIPQDEHGINVEKIMTVFRKAVKDIDRWEVLEKAYIGHFSFTKFLMWRDLEVRTKDLEKNRIVSHLINTPNERFGSDEDHNLPDPDTLDDTCKPSDIFCPVDADSYQLAAVRAAAEGKSFVLHGPPGTGKSQTITNIIANALANGKSVLFISEKMAALNVVYQRLTKLGLDLFCLELHSNKSHKKHVIDQLAAVLDRAVKKSSNDWLQEANRLANLRSKLNAYVRALHQIRETGESLFKGRAELIRLRHVKPVPMNWPADKIVNRDLLDQLRDVVSQLKEAAMASPHPRESVWSPVQHKEWSIAWRNEVESCLKQLRDKCRELQESAQTIGPLLGFGTGDWSERDLRALNSVSKFLLNSPAIPAAMVTAPDWNASCSLLTELIKSGSKRDSLRDQLYQRYTPKLLQLDLDGLQKQLVDGENSWFLPRAISQWKVKKSLQRVTQPGQMVEPSSMLDDIKTARDLQDEQKRLDQAGDRARELLGQLWQDGEADWKVIAKIRDATSTLCTLAEQVAETDNARALALRQQWSRLVDEEHEQLSAEGTIGRLLQDYINKAEAFISARKKLESVLSLDAQAVWGNASSPNHLGTIVNRIDQWIAHFNELQPWCHWHTVRDKAIKLGLGALINAYERGELPAERIPETFERSYYQWWVDTVTDRDPALRSFFSREFERKIRIFRELDQRYIKLTCDEIKARLTARLPREAESTSRSSEMGILKREIGKKSRHMPIRQLFQKIPNLLRRIKPCLLMSPISVAQYLDPAHPPFDLVIIDEASQMPVWDAVGAIGRGREAIIVGDPKQLPPTSFFIRSDDDDMADEVEVEDLESILDDCLAAGLPSMHLRWHYRSRHESLIAFSNYQYYDNRLLTFPSPDQKHAVSLRPVNGIYDKSKSRTNQAEAEAVVEEILRRLQDPELSRFSIGVVTFNISQQELIEDLLDVERRKNPEIEQYFSKETAPTGEPVFVKNLENVQGDERDVILFSVCYGPDAQGRISMNFGPLNRDGGERRLNVAITRARKEVIVFSSLQAEDIDLSRTRAKGVADLKSFLDYAAHGVEALVKQSTADPEAECESIFEEQVCEALRNRGYIVHPQVGCSGYRIDLAIVDPEHPGRYLLGIECDGANYHRAKTARDRDRLREMVLRDLGWRLHRVWSTDWWEKPDEELARIEAAIEEAKKTMSRTQETTTIITPP